MAEITLKEKEGGFKIVGLWLMKVAVYALEVVDNLEEGLEEAIEEAIRRLILMLAELDEFGWSMYTIRPE